MRMHTAHLKHTERKRVKESVCVHSVHTRNGVHLFEQYALQFLCAAYRNKIYS